MKKYFGILLTGLMFMPVMVLAETQNSGEANGVMSHAILQHVENKIGVHAGDNASSTITPQQQKNASFNGTVQSVSSGSFVLQTKNRGNQTVNTSSSTVFKKGGDAGTMADLAANENVTVSGVWDSSTNTVTASNVNIIIHTMTVTGTVASISGNTITLTGKNTTNYSVDASNAKFVRRFGATMLITDIQTGDTLSVTGTVNGVNIEAKIIRNMSLQAHNGTFVGTVSAINGSSFTLQSKERGSQTINTTSTTVFRLGNASTTISGIAVGQTVTVRGVWDRTNSNVTANRVVIKVLNMNITGTLQSVSGNVLTVTITAASPITYSVDAGSAKIYYQHGYKGSLSILQTGDSIQVTGKATSGSTSITATAVRDNSQVFKKPVVSPTAVPPTPSN